MTGSKPSAIGVTPEEAPQNWGHHRSDSCMQSSVEGLDQPSSASGGPKRQSEKKRRRPSIEEESAANPASVVAQRGEQKRGREESNLDAYGGGPRLAGRRSARRLQSAHPTPETTTSASPIPTTAGRRQPLQHNNYKAAPCASGQFAASPTSAFVTIHGGGRTSLRRRPSAVAVRAGRDGGAANGTVPRQIPEGLGHGPRRPGSAVRPSDTAGAIPPAAVASKVLAPLHCNEVAAVVAHPRVDASASDESSRVSPVSVLDVPSQCPDVATVSRSSDRTSAPSSVGSGSTIPDARTLFRPISAPPDAGTAPSSPLSKLVAELEDDAAVGCTSGVSELVDCILGIYAEECTAESRPSPAASPAGTSNLSEELQTITGECLDDVHVTNRAMRLGIEDIIALASSGGFLGVHGKESIDIYTNAKAIAKAGTKLGRADVDKLERRLNDRQLAVVEWLKQKLPDKYHRNINVGHRHSKDARAALLIHYAPEGTKSNGVHCMPFDQCCVRMSGQTWWRYELSECFGGHDDETFFHVFPMHDFISVALEKGTQTELNDQCDDIASYLEISRVQFYALSVFTLIDRCSLNLAQGKGPLAVLVASAPASNALFGEVGAESYLKTRKSDGADVRRTLHPESWYRGANKSMRLFPVPVREAINVNMTFMLGELSLRQDEIELAGFVTNMMNDFGGDWRDSDIQRGLLSHLAKVAYENGLLQMSGEALANVLARGDLNVALGQATVALFLDQIDLFGPAIFMRLLRKFRAGHELPALAARLDSDHSVPNALESDIERVRTILNKTRSYILTRLLNLRRAQDYLAALSKLAKQMDLDGEQSAEFMSAVATLAESSGKSSTTVMQHLKNTRRAQIYLDALSKLAKQMQLDGEQQSAEFMSEVACLMERSGKSEATVLRELENTRRAQHRNGDRIGSLSKLASKLLPGGEMPEGLEDEVAAFARQHEKDEEVVMQHVQKCKSAQNSNGDRLVTLTALASKMHPNGEVPEGLESKMSAFAHRYEKDEVVVLQQMQNLKNRDTQNGTMQKLASKLCSNGEVPKGLESEVAALAQSKGKGEEVVLQQMQKCQRAHDNSGTLHTLASKLRPNGEVPKGLESDVAALAQSKGMGEEVVLQQMQNIKRAKDSEERASNISKTMTENNKIVRDAVAFLLKDPSLRFPTALQLEQAMRSVGCPEDKMHNNSLQERIRKGLADRKQQAADGKRLPSHAARVSATATELVKDPNFNVHDKSPSGQTQLAKIMRKHRFASKDLYDERLHCIIRERVARGKSVAARFQKLITKAAALLSIVRKTNPRIDENVALLAVMQQSGFSDEEKKNSQLRKAILNIAKKNTVTG